MSIFDLLKPSTAATPSKGLLGDPQSQMMLGASLLAAGGPSLTPKSGFEGIPQTMALMQRQQMLKQEQERQNQERERALQQQKAQMDAVSKLGIDPNLPGALQAAQLRAMNGGNSVSYGKTPVMGKGPDGKPMMGVVGDDGSFKPLDTGGFVPTPGVQRVDLGTAWGILGKDGSVISTIPKDIAGAETQKVVGKNEGEKIVGREGAIAQARDMKTAIDGLISAPGRAGATGGTRMLNAPFGITRPGSETANFEARLAQLQGKAFLQAFESLKGGGQITEREGIAAQNAIARLDPNQSDDAFLEALQELKRISENAEARAMGKEPPHPNIAAGQPSGGSDDVDALIEQYGG
jgi:hypothetical protein